MKEEEEEEEEELLEYELAVGEGPRGNPAGEGTVNGGEVVLAIRGRVKNGSVNDVPRRSGEEPQQERQRGYEWTCGIDGALARRLW